MRLTKAKQTSIIQKVSNDAINMDAAEVRRLRLYAAFYSKHPQFKRYVEMHQEIEAILLARVKSHQRCQLEKAMR